MVLGLKLGFMFTVSLLLALATTSRAYHLPGHLVRANDPIITTGDVYIVDASRPNSTIDCIRAEILSAIAMYKTRTDEVVSGLRKEHYRIEDAIRRDLESLTGNNRPDLEAIRRNLEQRYLAKELSDSIDDIGTLHGALDDIEEQVNGGCENERHLSLLGIEFMHKLGVMTGNLDQLRGTAVFNDAIKRFNYELILHTNNAVKWPSQIYDPNFVEPSAEDGTSEKQIAMCVLVTRLRLQYAYMLEATERFIDIAVDKIGEEYGQETGAKMSYAIIERYFKHMTEYHRVLDDMEKTCLDESKLHSFLEGFQPEVSRAQDAMLGMIEQAYEVVSEFYPMRILPRMPREYNVLVDVLTEQQGNLFRAMAEGDKILSKIKNRIHSDCLE